MTKKLIITGAILGFLAVALGAFGAHGLKKSVSPEIILVFETGVRYQMYHAFLLLVVGVMAIVSESAKKAILYLVIAGTMLFSGSLFLISTRDITGFEIGKLGILTPIGGLLLLVSWFWLLVDILRKRPLLSNKSKGCEI